MRLSKAVREFNVSTETIIRYLKEKGNELDANPNTKLTPEQVEVLRQEFKSSAEEKKRALAPRTTTPPTSSEIKVAVEKKKPKPAPKQDVPKISLEEKKEPKTGFRIIGNIVLPTPKKQSKFTQVTSSDDKGAKQGTLGKAHPKKKEKREKKNIRSPNLCTKQHAKT